MAEYKWLKDTSATFIMEEVFSTKGSLKITSDTPEDSKTPFGPITGQAAIDDRSVTRLHSSLP